MSSLPAIVRLSIERPTCLRDQPYVERLRLGHSTAAVPAGEHGGSELDVAFHAGVVDALLDACSSRRFLGDHRFGGDQQSRDRGRALQGGANNLGRIDNALAHEIAEFAGLSVEAIGISVLVQDLADHDRAILARIDYNLARRPAQCLPHDLDTVPLVLVRASVFSSALVARSSATPPPGKMPSSTAARVACTASSTRSLRSLDFDLGRAADADYRDAAGKLGEPLLQLLEIVVGSGLRDLRLELVDARC